VRAGQITPVERRPLLDAELDESRAQPEIEPPPT
jgi:hypothetical protein